MATTAHNLQKEIKKSTTDAVGLARTTVESVQKEILDTADEVVGTVQKVFLAGLGALAVAEEEGSRMFKTLVKKGEKVEVPLLGAEHVKAVRAQLGGAADKATGVVKGRVGTARTAAGDTANKAEDRVNESVATVMKRLGVPTREEVAALTASVERLSANIEKLKAERAASASPEPSVEAVGGGWYEVRIGDAVVEKVQGRDAADAAVLRIQKSRA